MAIIDGGRHSVTHYDTLEAFVGTTLLEINLETGRTHQIRVHLAAIRHPCVVTRPTGRPGAGRPARPGTPVVARGSAGFHPPDVGRADGVQPRLSG